MVTEIQSYFYNATKIRNSKNNIRSLVLADGSAVSNIDALRSLAPQYYEKLFNQEGYASVFPKLVVKRILRYEAK